MKSFLEKFKKGLDITRTALTRNVGGLFRDNRVWTEDDYEELEAALISTDLGVGYSMRLVEDIRERYRRGAIKTADDILRIARDDVRRIMDKDVPPMNIAPSGPTVYLMVGVNGSGKTTTAGKLGQLHKAEGKKVMFAACDTFRAAAVEQIKIWSDRVGCDVVAGNKGADAAAVAYDACKAAIARDVDMLFIDTAGRQHTKKGLMDELGKIHRTIERACPGAPHENLLVVDGSAGSNGLMQAREFSKIHPLTGLCLTKLDGSGKGGIVVAIHEELHLPVRFIGLGEEPEDLQPFDSRMFAEALFPENLV
jgi:fused signal recognition particle receptor